MSEGILEQKMTPDQLIKAVFEKTGEGQYILKNVYRTLVGIRNKKAKTLERIINNLTKLEENIYQYFTELEMREGQMVEIDSEDIMAELDDENEDGSKKAKKKGEDMSGMSIKDLQLTLAKYVEEYEVMRLERDVLKAELADFTKRLIEKKSELNQSYINETGSGFDNDDTDLPQSEDGGFFG